MFAVLVFIGMFANVLGTLMGGNDNWSKQYGKFQDNWDR